MLSSTIKSGIKKVLSRNLGYIRFVDKLGETRFGVAQDDDFKTAKPIFGSIFEDHKVESEVIEVEKLLSPIVPRSLICIGLNYHKHAKEVNMKIPEYPVIFLKNQGSIQNPSDPIEIPEVAHFPIETDFEGELGIVIGKQCKNVEADKALDFILGYSICNDVSARRWQGNKRGGGQWSRAKSFDTFCPMGPQIVSVDDLGLANNLKIETRVNGEMLQSSSTSDMIWNVAEIVRFASQGTTLYPGDVILTGTPEGVGFIRKPARYLADKDVVSITIDGIGTLTNPVEDYKGPGCGVRLEEKLMGKSHV
eukprot:TRINITY_DN444_c1_g1_i1.p1 TRINITY_DN444_c1_g1~~TRINITY_DN444_c1_g1_i1.p1  ORF type:complete len:322 (-),score=58.75 TRINITY_DN444_c1_g1_i1:169-1089(-)